jgi:hypothetical protein
LAIIWLWKRKKEDLYIGLSALAGLGAAAIYINLQVPGKPFYFVITESFAFRPMEILKHAALFIPLAFFAREWKGTILLAVATIFGGLIHYNPFFPIFVVYFAGAMIVANINSTSRWAKVTTATILAILFFGFIFACYGKYDPAKRDYYPRYDNRLEPGLKWIKEHTEPEESFLAMTADETDLALVMEYRPVYLGYIGHLSHLGLAWQERYDAVINLMETGQFPSGVDYFFYGPVERKYFHNIRLPDSPVYQDNYISLYRLHN